MWTPSTIRLEISKPLEVPHLIAPFDLLNHPNSMLAFFVFPQTTYRDYWQNYPRRTEKQYDANGLNVAEGGSENTEGSGLHIS